MTIDEKLRKFAHDDEARETGHSRRMLPRAKKREREKETGGTALSGRAPCDGYAHYAGPSRPGGTRMYRALEHYARPFR